MHETMTVHKALCELKTLDSRVLSAIEDNVFVFANKHSNKKVSGMDIDAYCDEIKSGFQKANDLISRRDAIKRAVTLSNATVEVTINGRAYTVAEAIELKNHSIPLLKSMLARMTRQNTAARQTAERANGSALEERANEYVRSLYGGNADMKNMSDEIRKTRDEFIKNQTMEIVDPLNISDEMKKLEDRINGFIIEIDSALSVSNALTNIEINY